MGKLEVLDAYGFKRDVFALIEVQTADALKVKRILGMAIQSRAMISVVAERGHGKTEAVNQALRGRDVSIVRLRTPDRERLLIADVERAMILDLGDEKVKRTREVRARQLRRVLGEAAAERPVVLILEEAHRMHPSTLRSLKTLRELDWIGKSGLFTVVMIAQSDPMRRPGVDEVRLRTDMIRLQGLTAAEVIEYVKATVGRFFELEAMSSIAQLHGARNYLDLQDILISTMTHALHQGRQMITTLDVFELYGGGLSQLVKKVKVTYAELETETGIPRSTINLVANNNQGTLTDSKFSEVKSALSSVLKGRMEKEEPQPAAGLKIVEEVGL